MNIRKATKEDIPAIMEILQLAIPIMQEGGNFQWDNNYPNAAVFQKDIDANHLWVAEIDDQIAGVSAITTDQEPEYEDIGWNLSDEAIVTHRLVVSPNFRGKGVATALLEQAEKEAKQRNIKYLRIDTNTKNPVTTHLFPKLGYQFFGEIGLHFRPGLRFYCYQKTM